MREVTRMTMPAKDRKGSGPHGAPEAESAGDEASAPAPCCRNACCGRPCCQTAGGRTASVRGADERRLPAHEAGDLGEPDIFALVSLLDDEEFPYRFDTSPVHAAAPTPESRAAASWRRCRQAAGRAGTKRGVGTATPAKRAVDAASTPGAGEPAAELTGRQARAPEPEPLPANQLPPVALPDEPQQLRGLVESLRFENDLLHSVIRAMRRDAGEGPFNLFEP